MSTDTDFIEYVHEQAGFGGRLTHKRMFGEYALYLDGKVVAFACDNSLLLEAHARRQGAVAAGDAGQKPYPEAKDYYVLDEFSTTPNCCSASRRPPPMYCLHPRSRRPSRHAGDKGEEVMSDSARSRKPPPTATQRALAAGGASIRARNWAASWPRGVEAGEAEAAIDTGSPRRAGRTMRASPNRWCAAARPAVTGGARARRARRMHGLDSEAVAAAMDGFDGDWTAIAATWFAAASGRTRRRPRPAAQGGRPAAAAGFAMEQVRAALGGGDFDSDQSRWRRPDFCRHPREGGDPVSCFQVPFEANPTLSRPSP